MREFRPPQHRASGRLGLLGFIVLMTLVPSALAVFGTPAPWFVLVLGPALVVGLLAPLAILGPSRMVYRVGEGALDVRTLFGSQRWSLAGATARAHVPSRLWRVAGTAMPGYLTGVYREDGRTTRVYATDLGRAVLIEGPARVIVSPEHRDAFLAALRDEGARVT